MRGIHFAAGVIAALGIACGTFSGTSDVTPPGGDAGTKLDAGGDDASDAAESRNDGSLPTADADTPPSGPIVCANEPKAIFCDDFENVVAPYYGFTATRADPNATLTITSDDLYGASSSVLHVDVDTSTFASTEAPSDTNVYAELTLSGVVAMTMDYDFKIEASSLSYNTYGIVFMVGDNQVGVGANTDLLGQPLMPTSGFATVKDNGGWHHVHSLMTFQSAAATTSIDGVLVQNAQVATNGANPAVIFGIFSCGAVFDPKNLHHSIVDFDNVIVRNQ